MSKAKFQQGLPLTIDVEGTPVDSPKQEAFIRNDGHTCWVCCGKPKEWLIPGAKIILCAEHAETSIPKQPTAPLPFLKKLQRVMADVGYIQKRGENKFHKYSYVMAADVAEKAREAFVAWGLVLIPAVKAVELREKQTKDGLSYVTRVTMQYRIVDVDSDDYEKIEMVVEGQDPGDKGIF